MKTFISYIYKILIIVVAVVLIWLIVFGVKNKEYGSGPIGGILPGIQYSIDKCFGFVTNKDVQDLSVRYCHGIPGPSKCFGDPYTVENPINEKDIPLDCNYPCNDENIKNICKINNNGLFGRCNYIKNKCHW